MNHLTEEELVLLYYEEPGVSGQHLVECEVCRKAAELLALTLTRCDDWIVPEPRRDFCPDRWDRRFGLTVPMKVAFATFAAAAMLLIAFTAGRVTKPVITAGLSQQARERILEISLADHLDRAGMLLTEVANSDAPSVLSERGRAEDLVEEGRLMRQALTAHGESATSATLDEVERVLLEIANAPARVDVNELMQIKRRIEDDSLVFKVRIIETNLRSEGQKS